MTQPPQTFGQKTTRVVVRLVTLLGALALLGVVGVLLAELNARSFTVVEDTGRLVIHKGRHLPVGMEPFRPSDLALADTYAPITIEGPVPGTILGEKFRDRDELDRALFDVLEQQAKPRVVSDDPATLEKGLYALRRAERLTGLSIAQKESLKRMQVDVSYFQARLKLDEARRIIGEAVGLLRVAAGSQNTHARSASAMIAAIEPQTKSLEDAIRVAVHQLARSAAETVAEERNAEPDVAAPEATADAGVTAPIAP